MTTKARLTGSGSSACSREPVAPSVQSLRVLPAAQRTVAYASAVLDAQSPAWLAQDAISGCAVELDDAGAAILKVYLTQSGVVLPTEAGGLPVVAEVTGPIAPFALTDRIRPLPIGVSLGNNAECLPGTIGCLVERAGVRYALSANHVLARQNQGVIGEDIMQPSRPDGSVDCSPLAPSDRVAQLAEFEPVVYDGKTPNEQSAMFLGMVSNIDDNVGRLLAKLKEWNLENDTLFCFMNDNGGTAGGQFQAPTAPAAFPSAFSTGRIFSTTM